MFVTASGTLSLVVPVTCVLLSGLPILAQEAPEVRTPADPTFVVASIRPEQSGGTSHYVNVEFQPRGYTAAGATLDFLLQQAYGISDEHQITGAPRWASTISYSIEARIDESTALQLGKLNPNQLILAQRHMLQQLLADRFYVKLHIEARDLPVFSLVIDKDGPKVHQANPAHTYVNGAESPDGVSPGPHFVDYMFVAGHVHMKGEGASVSLLIDRLTQHAESLQLGRTLIDNTGLKGDYDFDLSFTVPWGATAGQDDPATEATAREMLGAGMDGTPAFSTMSLFTAFKDQLGLRLDSTKGPVAILVIDHAEAPSEN